MSNILPENNLSARLLPKTKDFDRFSHRDVMNQTSNYEIIDHIKNKVWGYVSIDNTKRGPGLGGLDILVADRDYILEKARERNCDFSEDRVNICGTRFYLHDK